MTADGDAILEIKWTRQDIACALEEEGIAAENENIDSVIRTMTVRLLEEQSIKRGWEVIHSANMEAF